MADLTQTSEQDAVPKAAWRLSVLPRWARIAGGIVITGLVVVFLSMATVVYLPLPSAYETPPSGISVFFVSLLFVLVVGFLGWWRVSRSYVRGVPPSPLVQVRGMERFRRRSRWAREYV